MLSPSHREATEASECPRGCPTARTDPNCFVHRKLVPLVQVKEEQFAVLLLTHEEDFTSIRFTTRSEASHSGDERIFPSPENFRNYMISKPDGQKHAEAQLIEMLVEYKLLEKYMEQMSCQKVTIVLFTWLGPCKKCTKQIMNKLHRYLNRHKVIVMYKKNYTDTQGHRTERMKKNWDRRDKDR